MNYLKIHCINSGDAKNKLSILKEYGVSIYPFNGETYEPCYYILDTDDQSVRYCIDTKVQDIEEIAVKDIPEVCYDFFHLPEGARNKAYVNNGRNIINLLNCNIKCWFGWDETSDGPDYWMGWYDILHSKNIIFPDISCAIDDQCFIKKEEYESRLQEQKAHLSGRDGAKPIRFHGGKHQVRITSKYLSYQKVFGRG